MLPSFPPPPWRFIIVNICELLKSWLPIFSFCWPSLILTHSTLSTKPFFIETSRALKPVACSYLSHPFTLTFQHGFKDKYFKVFISIVLAQQPNPEECLHIKKSSWREKTKNTSLLTRLTQNSWLQFSAAYSTVYHSVTYLLRLEILLLLELSEQLLYHIFISKWGW